MKPFNADNLVTSLEVMGKGMLGIFVVMILIYLVCLALAKFTKESKED
jgi:hypothetical protein